MKSLACTQNGVGLRIELVHAAPEQSLWEAMLAQVAQAWQGRLFDVSLWLLPDERHRRAAELSLLAALKREALPLHRLSTFISLASEVLGVPWQSAVVRPALVPALLSEILRANSPDEYQASGDKPGFARFFWESLSDAENRGHLPFKPLAHAEGSAPPQTFTALQRRFHKLLRGRGLCTRGHFIYQAIELLHDPAFSFEIPAPFFLGPLQKITALERVFLHALLARTSQLRLAMPAGISPADLLPDQFRSQLPSSGISQIEIAAASQAFIRPDTPEAELDAVFATIARGVAEDHFHYRDIRLFHPTLANALPRIQAAAGRYRVPLKGSIDRPLAHFGGAILLHKILQLFESNWDREPLLDLLRSQLLPNSSAEILHERSLFVGSILRTVDRKSQPPGAAWIALAPNVEAGSFAAFLQQLQALDLSGKKQQTGMSFAAWIRTLLGFIRKQQSIGRDQSLHERLRQANLEADRGWEALERFLDEFQRSFSTPIARSVLIREFDKGLQFQNYAPEEKLLDAVEILSPGSEDHLPAEFIVYMGLSSHVPLPDRHNPLLNKDGSANYTLKLRYFLQCAANARHILLFSCPRFNDRGDELALSPFLQHLPRINLETSAQQACRFLEQAESWHPYLLPKGELPGKMADSQRTAPASLRSIGSIAHLSRTTKHWSPSRLDRVFQCLYLHFAHDVMNLRPMPDAQRKSVTPALLGNIAHQILKQYLLARKTNIAYDIRAAAQELFEKETARYESHPEIVRAGLELIHHLDAFANFGWEALAEGFVAGEGQLEAIFGKSEHEPRLELQIGEATISLKGRIDRLDVAPDGRALVIDYKYQKAENESSSEFFKEIQEGWQPQLPLYWLAAQRLWDLNPAAILQIYLKDQKIMGLALPSMPQLLNVAAAQSDIRLIAAEEVKLILANIISHLSEKIAQLTAGVVTPKPRDYNRCGPGKCDYADLCRYREGHEPRA